MSQKKPTGDIDFIIMVSAQEESRFTELLSAYLKEYPELEKSVAQQRLIKRISELVVAGKVGIYECERGLTYLSANDYRDISIDQALGIIRNENNWTWDQQNDERVLYYLFQKDNNYYGQYFGALGDKMS